MTKPLISSGLEGPHHCHLVCNWMAVCKGKVLVGVWFVVCWGAEYAMHHLSCKAGYVGKPNLHLTPSLLWTAHIVHDQYCWDGHGKAEGRAAHMCYQQGRLHRHTQGQITFNIIHTETGPFRKGGIYHPPDYGGPGLLLHRWTMTPPQITPRSLPLTNFVISSTQFMFWSFLLL